MSIRVGIIGGGAAGLYAACQLNRLKSGGDVEVTMTFDEAAITDVAIKGDSERDVEVKGKN